MLAAAATMVASCWQRQGLVGVAAEAIMAAEAILGFEDTYNLSGSRAYRF